MAKIPPITFTYYPADGDKPAWVRVHNTPPEQGRPSEGSPGAAGSPPSASGGNVPVEIDLSDDLAAQEALALLLKYGVDHAEAVMARYHAQFVLRAIHDMEHQKTAVRNPAAWIVWWLKGKKK